jgi:hypothetical protein
MFGDFFEFCTLENPVFKGGLFWVLVFIVTGSFVIKFKI